MGNEQLSIINYHCKYPLLAIDCFALTIDDCSLFLWYSEFFPDVIDPFQHGVVCQNGKDP
jgi:hypothetical protein